MTDPEIAAAYQKLKDSDTVAAAAGCSSSTVLAIARRFGVPIGPRGNAGKALYAFGPMGHATLTMEQVVALYKEGLSGPEVARRANVTPRAIYEVLKRFQVDRRNAVDEMSRAAKNRAAARRLQEKERNGLSDLSDRRPPLLAPRRGPKDD